MHVVYTHYMQEAHRDQKTALSPLLIVNGNILKTIIINLQKPT